MSGATLNTQLDLELVDRFEKLCRAWFQYDIPAGVKSTIISGLSAFARNTRLSQNRHAHTDKICLAIFLTRLGMLAPYHAESIKQQIRTIASNQALQFERAFFTFFWLMDKANAEYAYSLKTFTQKTTGKPITPFFRKQLLHLELATLAAVDFNVRFSREEAQEVGVIVKARAAAALPAPAPQFQFFQQHRAPAVAIPVHERPVYVETEVNKRPRLLTSPAF